MEPDKMLQCGTSSDATALKFPSDSNGYLPLNACPVNGIRCSHNRSIWQQILNSTFPVSAHPLEIASVRRENAKCM